MSISSRPPAAEPISAKEVVTTRGLSPSAHLDTFARDNLPPRDLWPHLKFDRPELQYAPTLNCADALLSRAAAARSAAEPCLYYKETVWSYEMLLARANQVASVLAQDLGLVPGNRVLLRGANTPWLLAAWLGTVKAGGIAVTTMPLLRAAELIQIMDRAKVDLAICEDRLIDELALARRAGDSLRQVVTFAQGSGDLERRCRAKGRNFQPVATAQDDVALIAFTSGTTGQPKATMHFHRDVMAICDTFARHILRSGSDEIFTGTPPLGFTFGLGALLAFPLSAGAAIALPDRTSPDGLLQAIAQHGATTCFTSPSGYRAMLPLLPQHDVRTLRKCVAAGEYLPAATSDSWFEATGRRLIDGIGATEMLHIFISAAVDDVRPGATGKPVPGYEACLLDEDGRPIDGPGSGRLAVRGPTGCRYLADPRQSTYVVDGWNVTGDCYRRDSDGYYWFEARADDMIVSSGYNIAAPEVERALLEHASVAHVAVVAAPDEERGSVVKAFIVLKPGFAGGSSLSSELQNFVKARIAPYKYPRLIEFVESLPQTATGKLKRYVLRQPADADTTS